MQQYTLDDIAASGNNSVTDNQKWALNELFYALKHPAIVHYIWPKPFWKMYTAFGKEWWNIAKLTGYYNDIYNKSPTPK